MSIKNTTETDVVVKLILPIIKKLGFDEQIRGEVEYEKSIQIGRNKYVFPDIVINLEEIPAFVIEAKKPTESLDMYERQILSYGLLLKTPYCVLTNGVLLRIYETNSEKVIWEKSISEIPKSILGKEILLKKISKSIDSISEERIEEAKKTLLVFEGIKEFASILYKCEDIIRDIDGLTGADAFDEISKILFTKMYYEKKASKTGINEMTLSNIKERGVSYVKEFLFPTVIKNNKDIFIGDEKIELADESIEKITEHLENYTLIKTDIDVKGRAFEIFLGKTFTGGLGQFFTPRTIVTFAVKFANPELDFHNGEKEEPTLIIDPACGSGGFLIETFKELQEKIKTQPKSKYEDLFDRLSKDRIYGVDINPRLVRVAKMNMVLHGDGHGGIYKNSGLENVVETKYEKEKKIEHKKVEENKFHLIITNPPFGNKDTDKKILESYELGKKDGKLLKEQLREILFVERCIKLAKKGGEIAILLPDGILNNEQLNYVRDYIRKHTIIKASISLPDKAFKASGANAKTSLLFLKKKETEDEEQPPIFMAMAEEVGYERKTKQAKEIDENDLNDILKVYREFRASGKFDKIKSNYSLISIINDTPSCFIIGKDKLNDRIDAPYYYGKYIFDLGVETCFVGDFAKISRRTINPKSNPTKTINYVQFSNIDQRLGSVTGSMELTGEEAPSRAKLLTNDGDIVCARVKDSEQNIAIIPKELNECVVSTGFVVLKPIAPMTSEALYLLLRRQETLNQVRWKTTGTIMPAISDDEYLMIKIPKLNDIQIKEFTEKVKQIEKQREFIRKELKLLSEIKF